MKQLVIPDFQRSLNPEALESISHSMATTGLWKNPSECFQVVKATDPTITDPNLVRYNIIAGQHRFLCALFVLWTTHVWNLITPKPTGPAPTIHQFILNLTWRAEALELSKAWWICIVYPYCELILSNQSLV